MKKIMTLCFFAFAMVMGTQTVAAQSLVEINSLASKKTQELKKNVKFDDATEHQVYEAFQAFEQKTASVTKIEASGKTVSSEEKETIKNMLVEKLKNIFTEDQFVRYLEFSKNKK